MIKFSTLFALCVFPLFSSPYAFALDTLDDSEMASTTGQDGVTINFNFGSSGITFDHMVIEDRDGFGTTHTNAGGFGYITQGSGKGVGFYGASGVISNPLSIVIDADGNNNAPVMNVNVLLDNVTKIKLDAFSLGLVRMESNASFNNNTRRDILKTGASGIDINFASGSRFGINLQLGHQSQGALFKLVGSLQSIVAAEPIQILSYKDCLATAPCASNSNMQFGLELNASNDSIYGIRLNNISGNTTNEGLLIANAGTLDSFDLKIKDVTFGNVGSVPDTNQFNGLNNGSIGTIGIEGIEIDNLKMNIRGM